MLDVRGDTIGVLANHGRRNTMLGQLPHTRGRTKVSSVQAEVMEGRLHAPCSGVADDQSRSRPPCMSLFQAGDAFVD